MNTKPAPTDGSIPCTENTAGKIIIPAITATRVSIKPTDKAVLFRCTSRLKYEAYVTRPIPKENE